VNAITKSKSTVNAAEKLAKDIINNYDNQLQSSTIDLPAHVESLLQSLGATTSDSGGKVSYYGSDPITPDRLPYGSISAISLAAKAILIAKIWKERTGEGQDIHVDVRKALRRLTPFLEGKWELVNGFPGRTDPYSPFSISAGPDIVPTRDGKWTMVADVFPALRQRAENLLKPKGGSYEAVRDSVKEWNGEELEEAGEKAGIPMPLARNIKDVLKMDDAPRQRRESRRKRSNTIYAQSEDAARRYPSARYKSRHCRPIDRSRNGPAWRRRAQRVAAIRCRAHALALHLACGNAVNHA
jgi:hypothetical protein